MIGISLTAHDEKPLIMPQPHIGNSIVVRVFLVVREQVDEAVGILVVVDRMGPLTHMPGSTDRKQIGRFVLGNHRSRAAPHDHRATAEKLSTRPIHDFPPLCEKRPKPPQSRNTTVDGR